MGGTPMSHVNFKNIYAADMLVVGWKDNDIDLHARVKPGERLKVKKPHQYTKLELITPQMLSNEPGLQTKSYGVDMFEQDSDLKYIINYKFEKNSVPEMEATYSTADDSDINPPEIVVGNPGVPPE